MPARTPRMRPRQAKNPSAGTSSLSSVLSAVGTLAPPLTIATSLMLYFGWARSDEQARFMGLDVSLFGYSTQDYVLRSIRTLYIPLLVIAAAALCWLALHRHVLHLLNSAKTSSAFHTAGVSCTLVGLGFVGGAVGTVTSDRRWAPLAVPIVLAAGTAITAYGGWLRRAARTHGITKPDPLWHTALRRILIGSVITLSVFWELSIYAGVTGRGYALELANSLSALPSATAFSPRPLGIEAPGVREDQAESSSQPRFRTSGLRLLVRSGGRLFLVHDGWTPATGTVIVIPDDGQVRWQFSR